MAPVWKLRIVNYGLRDHFYVTLSDDGKSLEVNASRVVFISPQASNVLTITMR